MLSESPFTMHAAKFTPAEDGAPPAVAETRYRHPRNPVSAPPKPGIGTASLRCPVPTPAQGLCRVGQCMDFLW